MGQLACRPRPPPAGWAFFGLQEPSYTQNFSWCSDGMSVATTTASPAMMLSRTTSTAPHDTTTSLNALDTTSSTLQTMSDVSVSIASSLLTAIIPSVSQTPSSSAKPFDTLTSSIAAVDSVDVTTVRPTPEISDSL